MGMITIKFNKGSHEEGVVKRTDSNLRANYYSLQTIIYKINESKYEIQLVNMLEFFDIIKSKFDKAIKVNSLNQTYNGIEILDNQENCKPF